MSIQLYNAFKTDQTFQELHASLSTFSVDLRKMAEERFTDYVTREVVYFYDMWCCGLGPTTVNPATAVREDIECRLRTVREGERDPSIDYPFSVTLFPVTDGMLILLFTEHDDFVKLFKEQIKVDDFSYWNNTDRPLVVDEEEWERRRVQWDLVFRASSIPAHVGYTRNLIRAEDFSPNVTASVMEKYIPSFTERCRRIALDMYVEDQDIKDFRTLHRLLSDQRASGHMKEYEIQANATLVETINPTILHQEHSR